MWPPDALDVSLLWHQSLKYFPAEYDSIPLMSALDGADPEGLEPVPEVHPSQLNTVSRPGSWDGLQGLDFIIFCW